MVNNEYEKFEATVWKQGDSLVITLPSEVAKFGGYEIGDTLKVMTRKNIPSSKDVVGGSN